jgi:hypothetical protein
MRRRRTERKALRLARLLASLECEACEQRAWRPRPRAQFAAFSAAGGRRPS